MFYQPCFLQLMPKRGNCPRVGNAGVLTVLDASKVVVDKEENAVIESFWPQFFNAAKPCRDDFLVVNNYVNKERWVGGQFTPSFKVDVLNLLTMFAHSE